MFPVSPKSYLSLWFHSFILSGLFTRWEHAHGINDKCEHFVFKCEGRMRAQKCSYSKFIMLRHCCANKQEYTNECCTCRGDLFLFLVAPVAYASSPARVRILSCSWDLCHSCSKATSLSHCTGPGMEPAPPQWPELLQRQGQILNVLHHSGNSGRDCFMTESHLQTEPLRNLTTIMCS